MAERVRETIEANGDRLADLHLRRLGPRHLGVIPSEATRRRALRFRALSRSKMVSVMLLT